MLVERICVNVVVNVPATEPVVVTVVRTVPVINGLRVVAGSIVAAAVETELLTKVVVTTAVWVLKDVAVVETVVVGVVAVAVVTMTSCTCSPTGVTTGWNPISCRNSSAN